MDILMAPPKFLPWWAALAIWVGILFVGYLLGQRRKG